MDSNPEVSFIGSLLVSLLGAACQETPVARESWDATVVQALTSVFDDDAPEDFLTVYTSVIELQVEQLVLHGFCTEGADGFTVAPALRSVVAQTLLLTLLIVTRKAFNHSGYDCSGSWPRPTYRKL